MTDTDTRRRSRQPEADCRSTLTAEIAAYMAMLPQIRAEHGSCWAVVTGGKLEITFKEFAEAARYADENFPRTTPVLIRHTDEKRLFAPYIGVTVSVRSDRQRVVSEWAVRCFGADEALSLPQRGLRHAEEAVEAAQAAGTPADLLHLLIDVVYAKPPGKLAQELGGSGVTLLALAEAAGLDADRCEEVEIERVLSKTPEFFAARNAAKNAAGLLAANPAACEWCEGSGRLPHPDEPGNFYPCDHCEPVRKVPVVATAEAGVFREEGDRG